jgi:hypothetical protein
MTLGVRRAWLVPSLLLLSASSVLAAVSFARTKPASRELPRAGLAVRVTNRSQPILCAEKDNVSILFQSAEVRRFTIEAVHPNYINMLQRDNWEADWTSCDMSGDPSVPAQPRVAKFYDADGISLVGYTYPTFWRKNAVPFRVGDRVEPGLHMVQLWITTHGRPYELMVVYPPDGYWRAHPLAPPQLSWSAYGSSFIVGPIEEEAGRPVVKFKDLAFDPKTKTFTMHYEDGSTGSLKVASADENRSVLEIEFDKAVGGRRAFAALRSMYVTESNADAARIALREPTGKRWREENVMAFGKADASDVWIGRLIPSHHNTSAPDMVFHRFER